MARPRTPKAKAVVSGQAVVRRKKFDSRKEPEVSGAIGKPPTWMDDAQVKAWNVIIEEIPWLNSSHRGLVEIASYIRGRMMSGDEVGVQALNLLRQCLGQMGATPSDASKITVPDDGGEKDELLD